MGQATRTPPNVMQTDPGAPPLNAAMPMTAEERQRQMMAMLLMGGKQPGMAGKVAVRQGPLDAMTNSAMQYMMLGGKLPGG